MESAKCVRHKIRLVEDRRVTGTRLYCPSPGCDFSYFNGRRSRNLGDLVAKKRRELHIRFDSLWKNPNGPFRGSGYRARQDKAYVWLRKLMRMSIDDCHIGMFDAHQCDEAAKHIAEFIENNK